MRVDSINPYRVTTTKNYNCNHVDVSKPINSASNVKVISFGGKNMWQILSFTPENKGLGLPETSQGGEGDVGYELIASLRKHEKIEGKPVDARSVMPYWNHNNPKGGFKFLWHPNMKRNELPDTMPAKFFIAGEPGEELQDVAKRLKLKVEDLDYAIQSRPNGEGAEAQSKYCIVEPTQAKGTIRRPSSSRLADIAEIPYQLMKICGDNPSYNRIKGEPHYFLYTPDLASSAKPYSYGPMGYVPFEAEIISSDGQRALADALIYGKLNTEEFGYYNPANVIMHDRPASSFVNHIANLSASGHKGANGFIMDKYDHNTGRNYQGVTDNPFKFFSVVGTEADAAELRNNPSFEVLERAFEHGINSPKLTDTERMIASTVMNPFLAPFKDGAGSYNITKIPIVEVMNNPQNVRETTVSHQFDKEMASLDTPNAAPFLTEDYAAIPRHPNLNGVTPANMRFDDNTAEFGRGGNGLSKHKTEFTTFKYDGNNIEEVIKARQKNAKWLTDLIWKTSKKGQKALDKLFFNEGQLSEGQTVWGALSPLKKGEVLIFGFGRPDEQKGFPITARGYLNYLQRTDISKEEKLKVKLLTGAGKGDENSSDYKDLRKCWEEVQKLDGGIYKHNWMNIDGFTPDRFAACSTHGVFTSRREMCGITPIQSKIAGVPYAATGTGGPVDYTNKLNGWLTPEPVELSPEKYGLSWENSAEEIDFARVNRQAKFMSDIFHEMIDEYTNRFDDYVAKCKKNIEEKVDWHENSEYNHGKSANQRLLTEIFETDKGWDERNQNPLKRLTGKFGEYKTNLEELANYTKSKSIKFALLVTAALITGVLGFYGYIRSKKTVQNKTDSVTNNNQAQNTSQSTNLLERKMNIAA